MLCADGSITTAKLADDAITSAKIADDAVVAAAIAMMQSLRLRLLMEQ